MRGSPSWSASCASASARRCKAHMSRAAERPSGGPSFAREAGRVRSEVESRRRHPHRSQACGGPRCEAPPPDRHRPRPTGPTPTTPHTAPTRALALGPALARVVAQRDCSWRGGVAYWVRPQMPFRGYDAPSPCRRSAAKLGALAVAAPWVARCGSVIVELLLSLPEHRPALEAFLRDWNSLRVARRGVLVDAVDHPAVLAWSEGELTGVATYVVDGEMAASC